MQRLTKQEKKLKKFRYMQETRKAKRKRAHLQKKVKRNMMLGEMTVEERKDFIAKEREQEDLIKTECDRVSQVGIPLIFDLSYCSLISLLKSGLYSHKFRTRSGFCENKVLSFLSLFVVMFLMKSQKKLANVERKSDKFLLLEMKSMELIMF